MPPIIVQLSPASQPASRPGRETEQLSPGVFPSAQPSQRANCPLNTMHSCQCARLDALLGSLQFVCLAKDDGATFCSDNANALVCLGYMALSRQLCQAALAARSGVRASDCSAWRASWRPGAQTRAALCLQNFQQICWPPNVKTELGSKIFPYHTDRN